MIKSERLRKLETELTDLEQWLKLGLVPKKDIEKHKSEIILLKDKIQEEKERLLSLKESGAMEDFIPPKRSAHNRQAFPDTPSLPDIEMAEEGLTDFGLDIEPDNYGFTSGGEETETGTETGTIVDDSDDDEDDEEDPFSDRNRWKRVFLDEPDHENW